MYFAPPNLETCIRACYHAPYRLYQEKNNTHFKNLCSLKSF